MIKQCNILRERVVNLLKHPMRIKLLAACFLLAFIGCSKDNDHEDLSGQRFVFHFYPSQAACEAAPGWQDICLNYVQFENKRQVFVSLGDIMYSGEYEVKNNEVRVYFNTMDINSSFNFQWEFRDKNTLVQTNNQLEWKRVKGPTDWDLY